MGRKADPGGVADGTADVIPGSGNGSCEHPD